jgi:predicted dehydrogenase
MPEKIKIIVIGTGNMGSSHARSYFNNPGYQLVGLVNRSPGKKKALVEELGGVTQYDSLEDALSLTNPEAAAVCTYPDTHKQYTLACLEAGLHVFVEKPLAETVADAEEITRIAGTKNRKVVVGYILRHHPAWKKFISIARTLGKPLVMRMNLNQQSSGPEWSVHKQLMRSMSPIVDCGVHYVDVMCQMTRSRPIRVQAIGARLSDEIAVDMYNYGQLQVVFADQSVGWYEAGWGPMISEVAFFVKDVIGPKGCVSIVDPAGGMNTDSANIDGHTKTSGLRVHHASYDITGNLVQPDELIDTRDEPGHQQLCDREQAFFLKAIREDLDLTDHLEDAVNSLRIVLAADQSVRCGKVVEL